LSTIEKGTNCKTAKIPIEYHRRNTNLRITKTSQKATTLLGIKSPIKRSQAPPQPRATNKATARKRKSMENSKTNRKKGTTTQPEDKTSPKLQGKLTTCYTMH
jgi:hypothetical protein